MIPGRVLPVVDNVPCCAVFVVAFTYYNRTR